MGISGLLPLLSEIQKPSHVKEWKGKTVAVDAYVRRVPRSPSGSASLANC